MKKDAQKDCYKKRKREFKGVLQSERFNLRGNGVE